MVCCFLLCDCCVFVCAFFHIVVGVVRDLLCGDVWFGVVCVVFVCVCSLFKTCVLCVTDCVMLYGLLSFVSCSKLARAPCVGVICL